MYHSPVPLMVIRAPALCLVAVNGRNMGECSPGSYLALPAGDEGDYYVTLSPLRPGAWTVPVTRKISFSAGQAVSPEPDVSLCRWPGGVYEYSFSFGCAPVQPADFPRELDQLCYTSGRQRRSLSLYYEEGIKLLIEEEGRQSSCISLGRGDYGSLALYSIAGRQFAAVITKSGGKSRLLMLDDKLNSVLELCADHISLEEDHIAAIEDTHTLMGHQRRIKYTFSAGAFSAGCPETGFFTRNYAFPADTRSLATALCEAVRDGFEAEAMSYISSGLKEEYAFADIKDFLGNFRECRPPLSDESGRLLGLIGGEDSLLTARLFEFKFEGELVSDISEA